MAGRWLASAVALALVVAVAGPAGAQTPDQVAAQVAANPAAAAEIVGAAIAANPANAAAIVQAAATAAPSLVTESLT
jgi:hypothetical protein